MRQVQVSEQVPKRFVIPYQEELTDRLSNGTPAVLVARNSAPSGPEARRAAIQDLFTTLGHIEQAWGYDLACLLPPEEELDRLLKRSKDVDISHTKAGKRFKNTYVELDLRPSVPVIVLLSTGSARKVDEAAQQPFLRRLLKLLSAQSAVFLFARRLDRVLRKATTSGALIDALSGCYVGDMKGGVQKIDGPAALLILIKAFMAEEEAQNLEMKGPQGMASHTGDRMVDGRVRYGLSSAVPPGFACARLRSEGSRARTVLYLDDERWRPSFDECAYGLSYVDASQVENVRFALRQLGQEGWPPNRVAAELRERSYSTSGLRRMRRSASATFTAKSPTEVTLRSIVRNLAVYETGELPRRLPDGTTMIIKGCIPTDGPWAQPEDFTRIREFRARGGMRSSTSIRLVLAGLKVNFDGREFVLRSVDHRVANHGAAYHLRSLSGSGGTGRGTPVVDAVQLNRVIQQSIIAAGEKALEVVPIRVPLTAELIKARDQLESATEAVETLEAQRTLLASRATDPGLAGTALSGDLVARYEELATIELPKAHKDRISAEIAVEEAEQSATSSLVDVKAAELLDLLACLDDPEKVTHATLLRSAVRGATLTKINDGEQIEFNAHIEVGAGTLRALIPIRGSWALPTVVPDERIAHAVIDQLAKGVTYWEQRPPRSRVLPPAIGDVLGRDARGCWFLSCSDRRILRIGMAAAILGPDRDSGELAQELGEPPETIERIRHVWSTSNTHTWLTTNTRNASNRLFILAALDPDGIVNADAVKGAGIIASKVSALVRHEGHWQRHGDGMRVVACQHCGGHKIAKVRIREVAGALCLDCRRDDVGVHWPTDYDRYIDGVQHFIDAGLVAPCEPATSQPPGRVGGQPIATFLAKVENTAA